MSDESYQLPPEESLHCPICDKTLGCTPGELRQYIQDDSKWPRCCGVRMAVDFPVDSERGSEGTSP